MKNYLNSLIRKHRTLDKKIATAEPGSGQIAELKKLKLRLKDRIQRIQRGPQRQTA